jgi:hypothetical protein
MFSDSSFGNRTFYRIQSRLSKDEDFRNGGENPQSVYFVTQENPVICEESKKLNKVRVQLSSIVGNTELDKQRICESFDIVEVYVEKDLKSNDVSFGGTPLYADEYGVNPAPSSLFTISSPLGLTTANLIKLVSGEGVDDNNYYILSFSGGVYVTNGVSSGTCSTTDGDSGGGVEEYTDCEIKERGISPEDSGRDFVRCDGIIYIWNGIEWVVRDVRIDEPGIPPLPPGDPVVPTTPPECGEIISSNISPLSLGISTTLICGDVTYVWNGNIWIPQRDTIRR